MGNVNVEVAASDIQTRKADDRGRVSLGTDLADKNVTVAVIEVEEPDDE